MDKPRCATASTHFIPSQASTITTADCAFTFSAAMLFAFVSSLETAGEHPNSDTTGPPSHPQSSNYFTKLSHHMRLQSLLRLTNFTFPSSDGATVNYWPGGAQDSNRNMLTTHTAQHLFQYLHKACASVSGKYSSTQRTTTSAKRYEMP